MTQRERIMGICVGLTLGGLAVYACANWLIVKPFKNARADIQKEQSRQSMLEGEMERLARVKADWRSLTRRTLAADPDEAQRRFRADLHNLLIDQHGLSEVRITPGQFRPHKDGSIGVPLTIKAKGTLNQVVGFLCDFYRRDYLARLDKVRMSAEQSVVNSVNTSRGRKRAARKGGRSGGAASGPDGPELTVSITAVTLVLPKLDGLKHPVMNDVVVAETGGRLRFTPDEYNDIFEHNFFVPYEKPRAVVQTTTKPVDQPVAVDDPVVVKTTPPRDPRERPEDHFLTATTCMHGEFIAYVIDDQHRENVPARYRHDATIDLGKLLLIHQRGLVVRVEERGKSVEYFYALGRSFAERVRLDPEAHPEVWEALEREFATESPEEGAEEPGVG